MEMFAHIEALFRLPDRSFKTKLITHQILKRTSFFVHPREISQAPLKSKSWKHLVINGLGQKSRKIKYFQSKFKKQSILSYIRLKTSQGS